MASADGIIKSTTEGRLTASFVIDDITFTFSGSIETDALAFNCNRTRMEYRSLNVLSSTSTMVLEGSVAPTHVRLTMERGPRISAVLDAPISTRIFVAGPVEWSRD